ncbi:putative signal transducing protein [Luteimonas sp. A277]
MISVYQAAHGFDAYLVRDLLEQAGIPAQVRGEYLQGALGEVPASGMVTVWVAGAHATQARELVLDWEQSTPDGPVEVEIGDQAQPVLRPARRGSRATALIAAALLLPVLWWALTRLLG